MSETKAPQVITGADKRAEIEAMLSETDKQQRLKSLLPTHVPYETAIELVRCALTENPDLLYCTKSSIWSACCQSAQCGLQLNGPLMESWLVVYKRNLKDENGKWHSIKEAKFQIGYKGWIRLARNTDGIKDVVADVVYKEEVEAGLVSIERAPPKVAHRLDLLMDRETLPEESVVGAYAYFTMDNGGAAAIWVPRSKLDHHETLSKGGWTNTDKFPTRRRGMQRKTAVLQAFHMREVPISLAVERAMEYERSIADLEPAEFTVKDAEPSAPPQVTGSQEFTPVEESRGRREEPAESVSLEEAQQQDANDRGSPPQQELF